MRYAIKDDIPIPSIISYRRGSTKWPEINELKINQCFFIPKIEHKSLQYCINNLKYGRNKGPNQDKEFMIRKTDSDTYGCWRTK